MRLIETSSGEILSPKSIDSFVTKGIFQASDNTGLYTDFSLRDECTNQGCSQHLMNKYISQGDPTAYLIVVVSDTFKTGFEKSRIAPYVFKKRQSIDLLYLVETTKKAIDYHEARKVVHPLMNDMADFLMISMTINQDFLNCLGKRYKTDFLEDKTSRYYGQAALDLKKEGSETGLELSLEKLSKQFPDYISMMRWFAANCFNQQVIRIEDIKKLDPQIKRSLFEKKMDDYLVKFKDYSTLLKESSLKDKNLLKLMIKELNDLGEICSALNESFEYTKIEEEL